MGEALVQLVNALQPTWPLQYILMASVPYNISGGTQAMLMIAFAYMADRSKPHRRTVRMGLLDAAYYSGSPIGNAIAGPLLDYGGYSVAYSFVIALYVIAIVYVYIRLHTTSPQLDQTGTSQSCATSCDVTNQIYLTVQSVLQPRQHRAIIIILIAAMLCDSIPVWVMVMIVPLAMVKAQHTHKDGWLGVIGGVSRTLSNVCYYLVTSPHLSWLMWLGAVVASFKNLAPVAIRSLLSQLAGPQETGQIFAVMAAMETLVSLIAAPLYSSVYNVTIDARSSTFYLISLGFNSVLTLLLL
ncbi:hypothetical protein Pmani_032616 [Petrolisthes manimaculis]|uniref:Major facilitator superfamily (MFS) profile domain-containing protein n=1 Tax=Petrolisthes manimaculis TaxID=1843537 RepID=A0AAE1NRH1_9EUCA|nr:hypothetical protein Pmani_032616 [Petrolisthes manimaculis]